ncbi:pre-mRNA 3' end processing protein WDR33 isoform X2 [Oncorhynchus kisutch]|uniref:pre-mRNA 3' end processing protein WDR33 isoform X2 n=1 Tax=Oncorhynchus kisutch TaxID=8019 RepID=UPI0009A03933|nr:pre-mRNA 3' end processing protein WDR33-like isoform X2 [Oncorhynchus kisutch]
MISRTSAKIHLVPSSVIIQCIPKMVRPYSGPPRFKPRPYSDGYNMPHEENYSPYPRSQRGFRGHSGKVPPSWRDSRGRGRAHFAKRPPLMGERRPPLMGERRPPLMGERRERPFNQWRSQNQDSFNTYPSQTEPHHGHRRPSPSGPNRPPPAQHRSSPHTPGQGPQGQRGAHIHGNHSGYRSPSPRHYHNQPPDRRPQPSQSPHSSFRGPHKRPSPSHEEDRSWGVRPPYSPRERQFERPGRGGMRWNGPGPIPRPHNGERGPSGSPQRKPRDSHGRGPYPERWSAERDPRQQHGVVGREREGSGRRSAEWAQEGSPHHPPHRSPTWKGGWSSSSFHENSPQAGPSGPPHKRKFQERGIPPVGPDVEHGHPKRPRREIPHYFNTPRGFGGRPLSFRDKSRLLKGRKMRAESVMRLKVPPPQPQGAEIHEEEGPHTSRGNAPSKFALRRERFQANAGPLRKRPMPHQSPPNQEANSTKSSRDSESQKEHVDSQRALSTHRICEQHYWDVRWIRGSVTIQRKENMDITCSFSSSIDKRLARDLVVVSQWQAPGTNSSSKDSPPRDRSRTPKNKTERYYNSDEQLTLNERFSKIHDSSPSPSPRDRRYAERPTNVPQENHRHERPFRKPGPQRSSFRPTSPNRKPGPPPQRRPGPELPGPFRKPLMGGFVPRPFSQRPVFRKSQSILSKYRNMPTMRQHVPHNRGSNYRRW